MTPMCLESSVSLLASSGLMASVRFLSNDFSIYVRKLHVKQSHMEHHKDVHEDKEDWKM